MSKPTKSAQMHFFVVMLMTLIYSGLTNNPFVAIPVAILMLYFMMIWVMV